MACSCNPYRIMDFHNLQWLGGLLLSRLYIYVYLYEHTNLEELLKMEYLWAETNARELAPGDTVRVKANSFKLPNLKAIHDGRILQVLYVKNGDVVANSIDNKTPILEGAHYSPFHLEKRTTIGI